MQSSPTESAPSSNWLIPAGAALFALAAATGAGFLAFGQWPAEASRPVQVRLEEGQPVTATKLAEALGALKTGRQRLDFSGRAYTEQARLVLASLRTLPPEDQKRAAREAVMLFESGLRHKPNARGAWRGLLAAVVVADGPGEHLDDVTGGTLLFDGGDPFTALTLVNVALSFPDALSAEHLEQVLDLVPRLHATWHMRRPLARLYVSLPQSGRRLLEQQLEDGPAFGRWAETIARQGG